MSIAPNLIENNKGVDQTTHLFSVVGIIVLHGNIDFCIACWIILQAFKLTADVYRRKSRFRRTFGGSNSLDPDQVGPSAGLTWIQTVCKNCQQTILADKRFKDVIRRIVCVKLFEKHIKNSMCQGRKRK